MPFTVSFMRKLDTVEPGLRDVLWSLLDEIERSREKSVTKQEFRELHEIVKELSQTTRDLGKAQERSEHNVEELVDAQKRTEQKVEELADAQKRTEQKVEELADAQKRTEQELHTLVSEHKKTRQQLGDLSATVGYSLEDKAYPALSTLLKRDFDLIVRDRLVRRYVKDNTGHDIEVNIFGKATRNDEDLTIVGESKSQLSVNDVNTFIRKKLKRLEGVFTDIFPVLVTYMISSSEVEEHVKNQGIALYYSYDF
jgi:hypothetical protein